MLMFRVVILRMRNFSDESCRENHYTHFLSSNFYPFPPPPENRAVLG